MPGHSPGIGLPYDPDQARQHLAEAGYAGGQGFPIVNCLTFRTHVSLEENLAAQWRENLGVDIHWNMVEWREFGDVGWISKHLPHLFTMGWVPEYPDPDNFLRVKMGLIQQESGWRNEGYDSLVEYAQRSLDQRERMKLYGEAEQIMAEEAPIMPIHYSSYRFLVKPWVTGFLSTGLRELFLKDVTINPHERH
jgi:oligopeptide transport system substrate-binding protein